MGNIITYVVSSLDTFEKRAFTAVDSLVLSALTYLKFSDISGISQWYGVRLSDCFRSEYFETMKRTLSDDYIRLLSACTASPRFRNIRIFGYKEITDANVNKQFAAMCFKLTPDLTYVGYRGTDSTFIGWREDFNLALECPIPSQDEADIYLKTVLSKVNGKLVIGGHSKGGNLAVYAASRHICAQKEKITAVFSHDGPGFLAKTLEDVGFACLRPLINKTVPQASVVGLLLQQECDYEIIKSEGRNISQHNPFTWRVDMNSFEQLSDITVEARLTNATINQWVNSMEDEEFRMFIDAFFGVLEETDATSFAELSNHRRELIPVLLKAASGLSTDSKQLLRKKLLELASEGVKIMPDLLKRKDTI